VDSVDILNQGLEGKQIGDAIRRLRVTAVNEFLRQN
jgi:hypothetical protein